MPFPTTINAQMKAKNTASDEEGNGSSSAVSVLLLEELKLPALSDPSDRKGILILRTILTRTVSPFQSDLLHTKNPGTCEIIHLFCRKIEKTTKYEMLLCLGSN